MVVATGTNPVHPSTWYTSGLFMIEEILVSGCRLIDDELEKLLPSGSSSPQSIHQAMRHSVFAGGKRLRPILCTQAAMAVAGSMPGGVTQLAAALEMLHTYSLIHDDLPALDNDDLRRGKATCHVVFGEAIAILAGDALQTMAYQVLAALACKPRQCVSIIEEIARDTGTMGGMIAGQVMDLEAEGEQPDAETVRTIHRFKTGALITASVVTGGLYAGASASQIDRLRTFGNSVGLAFQIIDDVLDCTQSSKQLGKTAGKDSESNKATYPAVFGMEDSVRQAGELISEGCAALGSFGSRADTLKALAYFLASRKS